MKPQITNRVSSLWISSQGAAGLQYFNKLALDKAADNSLPQGTLPQVLARERDASKGHITRFLKSSQSSAIIAALVSCRQRIRVKADSSIADPQGFGCYQFVINMMIWCHMLSSSHGERELYQSRPVGVRLV